MSLTGERGRDLVQPTVQCSAKSHLGGTAAGRRAKYEESIANASTFWLNIAKSQFYWQTMPTVGAAFNFDCSNGTEIFQRWFEDGMTNMCYNCLDRHIEAGLGERVAYHWEGNEVGEARTITFRELHRDVCKLATVLKRQYGIVPGDRVSLYLPMIDCGPVAMLALARIGAVVSVVFGGFSCHSLSSRLLDSQSKLLITADGTLRGEKPILLKKISDDALAECAAQGLHVKCLVYERHSRTGCPMTAGRDAWYQDALASIAPADVDTSVSWVPAEHPLFMLYTSGSTGKPKGLLHTTGGYMVYAATTFKYVFDYHPDDVYFCTADIGWITGHSYVVYGPLLNAASSVLFEGLPVHPTPSRWWELIEKYKVSLFYTAPTAIRSLMKAGDAAVKRCNRSTLRVLGSVGEPINVAAWVWYHDVVGDGKCDIVDTYWQTETGGIMITPLPGTTPMKPGSATLPFFGIQPVIISAADQKPIALQDGVRAEGHLCMGQPWPGQARTIFGDHARYVETYFKPYPGYYFTGDGCVRDEDGYYWLTGRVDDVLNVTGHRLGTSEIECAINTHPAVVESAVVGIPHDIKGEGIYAYVTFKADVVVTKELLAAVKATCREVIGPIATPDAVQPAHGLPKTRSGKIMRRILRKIAAGDTSDLGDTSTLAEPLVVDELIALKAQWVK